MYTKTTLFYITKSPDLICSGDYERVQFSGVFLCAKAVYKYLRDYKAALHEISHTGKLYGFELFFIIKKSRSTKVMVSCAV